MNKYLYLIKNLKIKPWIKYWLIKQTEFKGVLSDILEGTSFYLTDSLNMKFKMFKIYGRTTQESTTGKNLAGLIDGTYSDNNVTVIVNNGKVTINGTPSSTTFFSIATNLNLISGDYVLYAFNSSTIGSSSTSGDYADIRLTDERGGNYGNYVLLGTKNNKIGISLSNDDSSAKIVLRLGANLQFNNFVITPMLIKGTSTTEPYEPYTGGEPAPNPNYPFPIKNTGDNGSVNENVSNSDGTQEQNISFPLAQGQKLMQGDYLADDGVHHKMGEITFDGSDDENWTFEKLGALRDLEYRNNFYIKINDALGDRNSSILNNRGIYANELRSNYNTYISNGKNLNYLDNDFESVEEFKEFLKTNNMKVQYKLETEVIEPYTEEQQAAWEQIKNLKTYKPVTHISSEDETPAELKIQYYKEG